VLSRIQQLIVVLIVSAVFGGAAVAFRAGEPVWALAAPLLIACGYVAALGLEFYWLRASYSAEPAPERPTIRQLLSAWWVEGLTAPRVFLWRQPFRSAAIPDFVPADARARRGVVLVHGFFCNRGLWNPWMRRLMEKGVPFVAVTLEPAFGSIDRYLDTIEAAVDRLELATGKAPLLVGHSMGGLAIRAWCARLGQSARFHRVITIGTPHRGTWIARHARTPNGFEMRIDSPWLQALARAEGEGAHRGFTCFWGHCDNIVFPTRSATLPGADNRHLVQTPHVAMTFHPEVFGCVLRSLHAV
jgi:triacylglycerol esterase/lipase EstA (alpha/beta hydrolase family)